MRIGPPDSLRFDFSGPLGFGAGAAVVVGDTLVWADPAERFRSLVPAVRLLWAVFGIVQPPAVGAVVSGRVAPPRSIWRFAEGADTLDYVVTAGSERVLEAEWRRGGAGGGAGAGAVVARSRTLLDDQAMPAGARIDFPEAPARLELSVLAVDTTAVIAPSLWRARR